MNATEFSKLAEKVLEYIDKRVVGKKHQIRLLLLAVLAKGHILIEDVPGTGKTLLAQSLADAFDLSYKKLQFAPDLLPSDITGFARYNQKLGEFEFEFGPIFTNVFIADDINRGTPKTQSALLEAMANRTISSSGDTYSLPDPFILIAAQNPTEEEGTFALPTSELDRFDVKLTLGYPDPSEEISMIKSLSKSKKETEVKSVVSIKQLLEMQSYVEQIYVADEIIQYIVDLSNATRKHPDVYLGVSPRGSFALFRISRSRAALAGRDYVIPDDIRALAENVLGHRLIVGPAARIKDISATTIIQDIMCNTPIPGTTKK